MIKENKTDPEMKDLLENPLQKETFTVITYKGYNQNLDEFIIDYSTDCGLICVGSGYCLGTGVRDIQFTGDFKVINDEVYLEDYLADKGFKITITTDE